LSDTHRPKRQRGARGRRADASERSLTAPGDRALQGILLLHGQIRNGGLLSALDYIGPEDFERAIQGFEYFGRSDVAELLANAYGVAFPDGPIAEEVREQYTMGLPDPIVDEIEASNERYFTLFPDDATLAALFERGFAERPGEFAPLE
jgi:hypothetical protein